MSCSRIVVEPPQIRRGRSFRDLSERHKTSRTELLYFLDLPMTMDASGGLSTGIDAAVDADAGTNFSPHADSEGPSAKVMLTISARNLRDYNPEADTDPYAIVSVTDASMVRTRQWEEIGRTECISNTLDPDWSTKICMTYYFEEQQRIQFEVFDKPGVHRRRLGVASMLLHEIVGSKYNRLTKPLYEEGRQYGHITVTAEELSAGRQESVYFLLSATNLDRKDFLGKSDPFLKISRINYDDTFLLAYRTRYHEQTLNPKWKPFEIHIDQLCYGDKDRPFLIECYDWDQDGNHDLVGTCTTTVNRLISGMDKDLPLINEKKAKKSKKYENSGMLHFHKVYCWIDFSFLDFITGGTELDFTVAVDFTKSNLPMDDASSLHKIDENQANQYEMAIGAIGEICQHYSRSKVFNAYGFGAKIPPDNHVHYNFPLNLETGDPRCYGIEGLLQAYLTAQSRVELSGPTDFAPIVRFAARRAASLPDDGSKYSILLIITDGVITDMEAAKEEIVKASSLPLSVIIVGVGYDSFEEMKVLDSDNQMLSSHGKYAKRDIVQFVQLRKYLPPHRQLTNDELMESKARLAKEVLYEVPGQLTSYMKSKGIFPRPMNSPFDGNGVSQPHTPQTPVSRHGSDRSNYNSPRAHRRILPTPPDEEFAQMHIY
ncbi:copine-5-like protein [Aphelenchoides avenae]|nr:copine-5-like protein [Aphelenchus avenae]